MSSDTSATSNQPSANQLATKAQAWSALFSEPMSDLVKRYTSSVFFDKRMWKADITGSLAHAEMLAAQGVIAQADYEAIQKGMAQIKEEIESGAFEWKLDLEDVHLNIEARLTQLVGDAGKRLHTGRSRNDQVATDVRLWLRDEIDLIEGLLSELQLSLVEVAEQNVEVILPGFTHLQVAQPVSFAHHHAGLRGDVRARRRAHGRRAPPHQRAAAGQRGAGRHHLPAGPRARGAHAGHGRRVPEQPGRRERPRLRHRVHRRRQPVHGAREPPLGRSSSSG
jgi:Argininosuccinate lyase